MGRTPKSNRKGRPKMSMEQKLKKINLQTPNLPNPEEYLKEVSAEELNIQSESAVSPQKAFKTADRYKDKEVPKYIPPRKHPRRHQTHEMGSREDAMVDVLTDIVSENVTSITGIVPSANETQELRKNLYRTTEVMDEYGKYLLDGKYRLKDEIIPYKKSKFEEREFARMKAAKKKAAKRMEEYTEDDEDGE